MKLQLDGFKSVSSFSRLLALPLAGPLTADKHTLSVLQVGIQVVHRCKDMRTLPACTKKRVHLGAQASTQAAVATWSHGESFEIRTFLAAEPHATAVEPQTLHRQHSVCLHLKIKLFASDACVHLQHIIHLRLKMASGIITL